jgi:hypothetical protein
MASRRFSSGTCAQAIVSSALDRVAVMLAVRSRGCDARGSWHLPFQLEATMGDKSPKSKQRDQKQKDAVKQQSVASAKTKQSAQAQPVVAKGKK